jgi:anhydro-N-acetylmuramic acid kinase
MNSNIDTLFRIANKESRMLLGLMSGTSLDGLDIALCKIKGSGKNTNIEVIQSTTVAYSTRFKNEIQPIFSTRQTDLEKVTLLHAEVARMHAKMILETLAKWELQSSTIDLIASHGQTIYHAPKFLHPLDNYGNATLQIGDGDILSVLTGIITISDFRQKHIATGGEGAPLALYGDTILFSSPTENRLLLNMGGIANFTYLPAGTNQSEHEPAIVCTDVGPANALIDTYIKANYHGLAYDKDGEIALTGIVNQALVDALIAHPFFNASFPKTIGPELFNLAFISAACIDACAINLPKEDIVATLSYLTAKVIAESIEKVVDVQNSNLQVYASGGGIHNLFIMQTLHTLLPTVSFNNLETLGIHPDAKEAVLFAVLANEAVAGSPSLSMGKISFPQ